MKKQNHKPIVIRKKNGLTVYEKLEDGTKKGVTYWNGAWWFWKLY